MHPLPVSLHHRARVLRPRRRTLAAVLALSLATPTAARATCRVVPGPEGEVGIWLVGANAALPALGPRPVAALDAGLTALSTRLGLGTLDTLVGGPAALRPVAAGRATLPLSVSGPARGPRTALAALTLDARTAGARWLFLGATDAVAVWLDGRLLFRRAGLRGVRTDDDMLALPLTAGPHRLVIGVAARGAPSLNARITGPDFLPDEALTLRLDGVDDAACEALAPRTLTASLRRGVAPTGLSLDVTLDFPGGTVQPGAATTRRVRVEPPGQEPVDATVPLSGAAVSPLVLHLQGPDDTRGALRVRTTDTDPGTTHRIAVATEVATALRRGRGTLVRLDPAFDAPGPGPWADPAVPGVPAGSVWSVARIWERLAQLVASGDGDLVHQRALAAFLTAALDDLDAGRDPYATRTGALRRAYRSPLDGTLQEYSVYVPPSYRGDRPWPLVVGLHGLNGSAHRMLPVLVGTYDAAEDRTHAERVTPPMPDLAAILAAPFGYGDTGFRQQGEYDVLRVTEEVQRAYRVDAQRTYLTGLSMGGIGAAGVSLHRPDVYAAAAPLCGYHSYFVRGDTRGVRRPWETFLMELRSNDHWAENGLHLPMYIVQGTRDRPLSNSQTLADRYTALGYRLEVEWPDLGHDVWSTTYAGGRIVPHFLRFSRDEAPRTLRFRTPDLRWNRSAWLTLDALSLDGGATGRTGRWGEVELSVERNGSARGVTRGVAALTLHPPASLVDRGVSALTLDLDGDRVALPLDRATSLVRRAGHWATGTRPVVRGGGALREVFDGPVLVVIGTGDPAATRLYERVARTWSRRTGSTVRYPVVHDDSLTDAMTAGRTLVLIGTPRDHRLLAQWRDRLPLRLDDDAIALGSQRFEGPDVGAAFAAPNPDDPARTVVVITGRSPRALLRSHSLPDLSPAFVVWDEALAPARGRVLLGPQARVRAAGFFDDRGAPVGPTVDPVPVNPVAAPATASDDADEGN